MNICQDIVEIIRKSLNKILLLRSDFVKKKDDSYVSKGDLLVQSLILEYIKKKYSCYTLISEEFAPFENRLWDKNSSYIVLDPIDGTENFISGLKEWGVGISIFFKGRHQQSCIYLPELNEVLLTGQKLKKFHSRIHGLSSSLSKVDLELLPKGYEYRIMGCSMYNMFNAIRGSYARFENIKGVHCWDILPGLNLAIEHGIKAFVDGDLYQGQILFPTKKYKILLES